jgi:hypothetical protein
VPGNAYGRWDKEAPLPCPGASPTCPRLPPHRLLEGQQQRGREWLPFLPPLHQAPTHPPAYGGLQAALHAMDQETRSPYIAGDACCTAPKLRALAVHAWTCTSGLRQTPNTPPGCTTVGYSYTTARRHGLTVRAHNHELRPQPQLQVASTCTHKVQAWGSAGCCNACVSPPLRVTQSPAPT